MNATSPAQASTLILRIWTEPGAGDDGGAEVRGEIRHVPSGAAAYFRRLEALPAAVARLLDQVAATQGTGAEP